MTVPDDNRTVLVSSKPRPWFRYWARMADTYFTGFVLGLVGFVVMPGLISAIPGWLLGLLSLPIVMVVNAFLLSRLGGTVGKWLFNIRVCMPDGQQLTFEAALSREFGVWLRGLGLGIPLVSLFTAITAYGDLNKFGQTVWDAAGGHVVQHGPIDAGRVALIVLAALFAVWMMTA